MMIAASTNSCLAMDSTWLRTIRAMVSHSTAPMATKSKTRLRSKKTMRMITKMVKGNAYMTSTKRIIIVSSIPPRYPAMAP